MSNSHSWELDNPICAKRLQSFWKIVIIPLNHYVPTLDIQHMNKHGSSKWEVFLIGNYIQMYACASEAGVCMHMHTHTA